MTTMNQTHILLPLLALVAWTGLILLLIPITRIRAGRRGQLQTHDFTYGESTNVPPAVTLPNRNYMNLLEAPTLFYLACVVIYLLQAATQPALTLAWAYVALRVIHSVIHLSYNRVTHRLAVFALSNGCLVAMWVLTGKSIAAQS